MTSVLGNVWKFENNSTETSEDADDSGFDMDEASDESEGDFSEEDDSGEEFSEDDD
jgi:hypothetical protein